MRFTSVVFGVIVLAIIIVFAVLSRFFVDLLWFSSLGFKSVVLTVWTAKASLFLIATVLSAVILAANGVIAHRSSRVLGRTPGFRIVGRGRGDVPELIELSLDKLPWRGIILAVSAVLGFFIGSAQTGNWDRILNWLYAVPFGQADPLFGHDFAFYVFVLPAYSIARSWIMLLLFFAAAMAAVIYWTRGDVDYRPGELPRLSPAALRHLS